MRVPAFVRALIEENPDLDECLAKAIKHFKCSDNVQGRAARMFALLAVAGELARRYGIVPWQNDYGVIKACVTLVDRWRE